MDSGDRERLWVLLLLFIVTLPFTAMYIHIALLWLRHLWRLLT